MSDRTDAGAAALDMMSEKHQKIITNHYEDLANNLTADAMLNKLVAVGIITMDEQEVILVERVTSQRAGVLLRLLLKRPDHTFYVLIEALKKYAMPHLAYLLEVDDNKRVLPY